MVCQLLNHYIFLILPTFCLFSFALKNINSASMNLRGTIPTEIGMLSRLTYLDLCKTINEITFCFFALDWNSAVHFTFKNSHTLCVCILTIAGNYLRGSIPSQFGLLQELEHLDLSKPVYCVDMGCIWLLLLMRFVPSPQ